MSGQSIIQDLYGPADCRAIVELCRDPDERVRQLVREAIGTELLRSDTIMAHPGLDQLMLICATAQFAADERECNNVAIFVHHGLRRSDLLPDLQDKPVTFASKALVALSLFHGALQRRHERRAAPEPDFFRQLSCRKFRLHGYPDIADHHRAWENLLAEKLGG